MPSRREVLQAIEQEEQKLPEEIMCPICHSVMADAVILVQTESSFCKTCLEEHLKTKCTDPMSGVELRKKAFVTDFYTRHAVLEWEGRKRSVLGKRKRASNLEGIYKEFGFGDEMRAVLKVFGVEELGHLVELEDSVVDGLELKPLQKIILRKAIARAQEIQTIEICQAEASKWFALLTKALLQMDVPSTMDVARMCGGLPSVVAGCTGALTEILNEEESQANAVQSIIKEIKRYKTTAVVISVAITAMQASGCLQFQTETTQTDFCNASIDCITSHMSTVGMQATTFHFLRYFAEQLPVAMAKSGGIKLIIQVMDQQSEDADVQIQACEALRDLATMRGDNQERLASAGSIEAVLRAMDRHYDQRGLQHRACEALANLACDHHNRIKIASDGGIEAIVRAMTRHVDDPWVQGEACQAIRILAGNEHNRIQIAAAGGITAIMTIMEMYGEMRVTQHQACFALGTLAINEENKIKIAQAGGIEALIKAMERHLCDLAVQLDGCRALANLSVQEENCFKIAASSGIERIIEAMDRHSSHSPLVDEAISALGSLSNNADNKNFIRTKGGLNAILKAMDRHRGRGEVQERACGALANLALDNCTNQTEMAEAGCIESIMKTMDEHCDYAEVQQAACNAFSNLAHADDIKLKMVGAGAIELIKKAIQQHENHAALHRAATSALRKLELV